MSVTIQKLISRIRKDERGVTLVEYGVAIALAVLLGISGLTNLRGDISSAMSSAGAQIP